jgi:hypothetical protein
LEENALSSELSKLKVGFELMKVSEFKYSKRILLTVSEGRYAGKPSFSGLFSTRLQSLEKTKEYTDEYLSTESKA